MEPQTTTSCFAASEKTSPDYQRLYEELKDRQQLMLSQISHEIRNPVTLINSFLQLFQTHHPDITRDECWIKAMENMHYLIALLEEFSSFNNCAKLNLKNVSLDAILRETVDSLTPLCHSMGISLIYRKETAIPLIQADPVKTRQVMLNLLTNAREAIGTQGLITCTLSCDGENIYFCVKDTGTGIPSGYQKDIFQPFVTHKQGGTGLGLAICQRIMQAHKGQIFFRSVPGQETEFHVVFPIT